MNSTFHPSDPAKQGRNPWSALIYLFFFSLAGWFLAQFATLLAAVPFFGFDQSAMQQVLVTPQPEHRVPLLVMQAVSSAILFIFTPWVYLRFLDEDTSFKGLIAPPSSQLAPLALLTFVIVLAYLPISGFLVEINEAVEFPEALRGLEQAFRSTEDQLKKLTEFLVKFDSVGEFMLGILVIGVLPGIGEELLFRGVLQNRIRAISGNVHVAIWVAAFLFSAIHFQFYGLIPRMALGALFGYLYVWSGSLLFPMLAHFINNAFTLTMMYLYHVGIIKTNIEEQQAIPILVVLISLGVVAALLLAFRRKCQSISLKT